MSFSFTVQARTKAAALEMITAKLAVIVRDQPAHAADEPALTTIATTYLGLLPDEVPGDEAHEYKVDLSGWLSWAHVPGEVPKVFSQANVHCTAAYVTL